MKKQTIQFIFGIGLLVLLNQQTAVAGSHREAEHRQNNPTSHQADYRHEQRQYTAADYSPNHAS